MNYVFVIIATVLLALDFALQKKYQASEGNGVVSALKFNALNGLFGAFIFLALAGFKVEFSLFSLSLAFLMSLFVVLYTLLGFKVLQAGGMAVYSVFLMSGGMLLPYVFGVAFLDEPLTWLRICGIISILVAVVLSNPLKYKIKSSLYLICAAVFILNGFVSIISKCHQISTDLAPVNSTVFVMYSGIGRFLFSSAALLFCKDKGRRASFSSKNTVFIIGCSALIGGVSYMLQLIGAKELPATVLYPLVTGGSIIFSALSGKVFFKEKISLYQWVSIALCFIGTLLFL